MERLVRDLLFLAREDEGRPTQSTATSWSTSTTWCSRRRRGCGSAAGSRSDTGGVSAAPVRGSREQLVRLVRNLLENAERHARTPGRGQRVRRRTAGSSWPSATTARASRAEQRERVFDRFVRLDDARSRDDAAAAAWGCRSSPRSPGGTAAPCRVDGQRDRGDLRAAAAACHGSTDDRSRASGRGAPRGRCRRRPSRSRRACSRERGSRLADLVHVRPPSALRLVPITSPDSPVTISRSRDPAGRRRPRPDVTGRPRCASRRRGGSSRRRRHRRPGPRSRRRRRRPATAGGTRANTPAPRLPGRGALAVQVRPGRRNGRRARRRRRSRSRRAAGRDEAVAAGCEAVLRRGLRQAVVREDGPRAAEASMARIRNSRRPGPHRQPGRPPV